MTRQERRQNMRDNLKEICKLTKVPVNALKRDSKRMSLKEKFNAVMKGLKVE